MDSMINPKSLWMYVDSVRGDDFIRDAYGNAISENIGDNHDKPLKTIYQAIKNANKRKFIGDSTCGISLLNDIVLSSNGCEKVEDMDGNITTQPIMLHHPDFIQNKALILRGWEIFEKSDGTESGRYKLRTIKYDQTSNDLKSF
jgi:hypothetical protein